MLRGFKNSWWVHLPSLVAIALMIVFMLARIPWPARAPAHFNIHWQIDRWGSPWESAILAPLAVLIVIAGFISSTAWSIHEEGRKRFNVTIPLISAPLGAIAGLHFWYWWHISTLAANSPAPHPWLWLIASAAILLFATSVLEALRRPMPQEQSP